MATDGPKKKKKAPKYTADAFAELLNSRILQGVFSVLRDFMLDKKPGFSEECARLREIYHLTDFDTRILNPRPLAARKAFDPDPQTSLDRSLAAFMSLHYSPREDFFEMRNPQVSKKILDPNPQVDFIKKIEARTRQIHELQQTAANSVCEASFYRDKIVFGPGGKSLYFTGDKFQAVHHEPEDLALASSDGLEFDVFGAREELATFSVFRRYPFYAFHGQREAELNAGELVKTYVFQMPLPVFMNFLHVSALKEGADEPEKTAEELSQKMGISSKKDWVELAFTDEDKLLGSESLAERSLVISFCQPSNQRLGVPQGVASRASRLAVLLTQAARLNINARERDLAPAWAVSNAAKAQGFSMGKDKIIFYGGGRGEPPVPLQVKASVAEMQTFSELYQEKHDRAFFLDAFAFLSPKSNITSKEVSLRQNSDLQKLTVFVMEDERSNLVPTIRFVNSKLNERENTPELAAMPLVARYISPLALAHKNDYIQKLEKFMVFLANLGKTQQAYPLSKVFLNDSKMISTMAEKMNLGEALKDGEAIAAGMDFLNEQEIAQAKLKQEEALNAKLTNQGLERDLAQPTPGQAEQTAPAPPPPAL